MRIAHFIQRYPPASGGSEAYFARLSRFFAGRGDTVNVFTSTAVALESFWRKGAESLPAGIEIQDGVTIHRHSPLHFPGRRYVLKALALFPLPVWQCVTMPCNPLSPSLWQAVNRWPEPVDVVHASAFPYAFPILCARRLAKKWNAPLILTPFLHLGDPENPNDKTRRQFTSKPLVWLLRQADVILVQTPSEFRAVQNLGIPENKIVLQGLGVDQADCTGGDRETTRRSWKIQADEWVIGHLANQSFEKGTIDLLRGAERVWKRGIPIRVVLAGPEMPNFRQFWAEFSSRNTPEILQRILRIGVLSERQKRDFFTGIDLFALPSRSDSFGLVLLEAWANGVPNLGYRAGGIADVIRSEQDGLLVPCGRIDLLAEGMTRFFQNRQWAKDLGNHGRERLVNDFCWDDKLNLVLEVYQKCLTSSGISVDLNHRA